MVTEVQAMAIKSFDVRGSTCPGGGALWALLSHTRDVPRGESIEPLTDDFLVLQRWLLTKRTWGHMLA